MQCSGYWGESSREWGAFFFGSVFTYYTCRNYAELDDATLIVGTILAQSCKSLWFTIAVNTAMASNSILADITMTGASLYGSAISIGAAVTLTGSAVRVPSAVTALGVTSHHPTKSVGCLLLTCMCRF